MPRHMMVRCDSNDLKFSITRLPSDDSIMPSRQDRRSPDSDVIMSDTNDVSNRHFSLSVCAKDQPLSPLKETNINKDITTVSKQMPILSSSLSSSGILGVKKNFLQRAFQRQFSPGSKYKRDQTKPWSSSILEENEHQTQTLHSGIEPSISISSHSVQAGGLQSPSPLSTSENNCMRKRSNLDERSSEIEQNSSQNSYVLSNLVNTKSTDFYSLPLKKIKTESSFLPYKNRNFESPTKRRSPVKKVQPLNSDWAGNDENSTKPSHVFSEPQTQCGYYDNKENLHPLDTKTTCIQKSSSPKFKTKLDQSPKKLDSYFENQSIQSTQKHTTQKRLWSVKNTGCSSEISDEAADDLKKAESKTQEQFLTPVTSIHEKFSSSSSSSSLSQENCVKGNILDSTSVQQPVWQQDRAEKMGVQISRFPGIPDSSHNNDLFTRSIGTNSKTVTACSSQKGSPPRTTHELSISNCDDPLEKTRDVSDDSHSLSLKTATAEIVSTTTSQANKEKMSYPYYIYPPMAPGLPHPNPLTPLRSPNLHDSGYHTPRDVGESSHISRHSAPVSGVHQIGASPILSHHLYGARIPSASPQLPHRFPSQYFNMTSTPLMSNAAFFGPPPSSAHLTTTGVAAFDERLKRERELSLLSHQPRLPLPVVPHPMVPMAFLPTFTGYAPYPIFQFQDHPAKDQQVPLDLSSSEQDDSPKLIPKTLFPGEGDGSEQQPKTEDEDKKNPFGIHKILGVSKSPQKVEAQVSNEEVFGQHPASISPPLCDNKCGRKRSHSTSSEESIEELPSKRLRDRPPLWGREMPECRVVFRECPEKMTFCKDGKYQIPDMPEDKTEQEKLCGALLRLFENSDLPPVPHSLRNNVIGLRFYPRMQTVRQAAEIYNSKDIVVSPGGLAFENFKAIEDNSIIDTMLEKRGSSYYCLGKKCIDPVSSKCKFKAKTLGKMRRHVKNHLPDKKWVCCFCRVQMTDQTDMARHGTTHTMLRPFRCDICHKLFTQKVTLINHLKTNHAMTLREEKGKDRFTCRQCGVHYTSAQRRECVEHLRKFHLDTLYASLKKRKRFPFSTDLDRLV